MAVLVALILLAGIAQYIYAQVALVEVSFGGLLKNALMLFLGYLPRSALGVLWQGIYWAAVALFWPVSSFAVILCSLWLPCLLNLMAIYPALDKSFDLEKTIKAMRDAQLCVFAGAVMGRLRVGCAQPLHGRRAAKAAGTSCTFFIKRV